MQNLNPELWMVIVPAIGWLLFALGGTEISKDIKGQKWIRRFVLPVIFGLCVWLAGCAIWKSVSVAAISCVAFHFGYGDKASWLKRLMIFAGYGLISVCVGLSWWNLITALLCPVLMAMSRWKPTAHTFVWKIVEGAFGAVIGVQIAYQLIF